MGSSPNSGRMDVVRRLRYASRVEARQFTATCPCRYRSARTGHGEFRRGDRLQALFDAVDDHHRLLSGLLGGNLAVPAEAHPLGPSRPAGLHGVNLPPRGVDPHPEAGEIAVPEDRVLVHDCECVDDVFGKFRRVFPRHAVLVPVYLPAPGGGGCRYSNSAALPAISMTRISSSLPKASARWICSPGRKTTGCCRPPLMAILSAYR